MQTETLVERQAQELHKSLYAYKVEKVHVMRIMNV